MSWQKDSKLKSFQMKKTRLIFKAQMCTKINHQERKKERKKERENDLK